LNSSHRKQKIVFEASFWGLGGNEALRLYIGEVSGRLAGLPPNAGSWMIFFKIESASGTYYIPWYTIITKFTDPS